jgi:Raf kinase inhibitor-like YbhB/YbcL family protein
MADRLFAALLIVAAAFCVAAAAPARRKAEPAFELRSASFTPHGALPKSCSCDGEDSSPGLTWLGAPKDARSFALVVEDPDAPAGTWVHWVVYDVPAASSGLPEGQPKTETLPSGAKQGLAWGVDKFERLGWSGPCPPKGKAHRYVFTLYALKGILYLPPKATKPQLLAAMEGKLISKAKLTGTYAR